MTKLQFTTTINAPKRRVWETMLGDQTYRQWTAPFHPDSYFEGSWDKGSDIRFLAKDDGKVNGMISRIEDNKLYDFISIEHLGAVVDGHDDTTSDRVKTWLGAHENYSFTEKAGQTELIVDLDSSNDEKMDKAFQQMWPEALAKLKTLAEAAVEPEAKAETDTEVEPTPTPTPAPIARTIRKSR